jgi:hypothetical protein
MCPRKTTNILQSDPEENIDTKYRNPFINKYHFDDKLRPKSRKVNGKLVSTGTSGSTKNINPGFVLLAWSNEHPTRLKKVWNMENELAGEDTGQDIKPNDVVLVYNRRAMHKVPDQYSTNRWFARVQVDKRKKKKNV